ncbi:dihydrolipoyl dehydrogenase family protein [Mobiluncus porci]|uniref:dihydrolipoyl dehydrogenase family protein n=1 Tax=Mobiluncus porci TaxID=2652278 RepID=UPI0030B8E2BA
MLKLAATGQKVVLIERSAKMYGGSCINIACIPTKTLITSALRRHEENPAAEYFRQAVRCRDEFIAKLNSVNYGMLEGKITLIDGFARFTAPHTLAVTPSAGRPNDVTLEGVDGAKGEEFGITADTIIVNTGTTPAKPEIPGIDLEGVYDSTTIQHVDPLPQSLLIVGASFVGLEFAAMFSGFGSEVTVVNRSERFLPRVDEDVAGLVQEVMESQGVRFLMGQDTKSITRKGSELAVQVGADEVFADAVLVAAGRTPATAGLGLEAAGVELDDRGFIKVDEKLRTSVEGIYAVGDINGGPQFTYISFDDNRVLESTLLKKGNRTTADRVAVPNTTFLDPPLAMVGLTEAQARETGREIRVLAKKIAEIPVMPRPKILGKPQGMAKVIVDATSDEILGAALYCVDSQELINLVAQTMRLGGTWSSLRDGIWTHPASTEVFNGLV